MSDMTGTTSTGRWRFYLPFGIAVLTILIYLPVLDYPFVNYDDNLYVTDNARTQLGLSWDNLRWAFTTGYPANWHPLTWVSHLLDVTLFGLDSGWHHAVNLMIHVASSVLLFRVLVSMTGRVGCSGMVAALFALHPLHVESVAWIAERKDVLCGFFWILTMAAYIRFGQLVAVSRYLVVVLCFALALMAKSMAVTLPCVLLLLDFWPLGRMRLFEPGRWKCVGLLILEKVPLFAMSVAASVIAVMTQREGGAMAVGETLPWSTRIGNALTGYGFYITKTFWPSGLAVYYPHPRDGVAWGVAAVVLVGIVLVSAVVVWKLRSRPYLAVGWFWFLGVLVPVIGLVQVGGQAYACRYAYLPHIGLFVALVWALADSIGDRRRVALIGAGVAVALCSWRTAAELRHWESSYALFTRCLAVTGTNSMAETALGNALINMGRTEEAIAHLDQSIALTPRYMEAHINKGKALSLLGRRGEEQDVYRNALELDPSNPKLLNNLGASLARDGKFTEAAPYFERAVAASPAYVSALGNLAEVRRELGDYEAAAAAYEAVLVYQPDREALWLMLANMRLALGDSDGARAAVLEALRIAPGMAEARAMKAYLDGAGEP